MGAGGYHYPVFRHERPRRTETEDATHQKDAMKFVAKILTIAAALSSLSMGANQVTVDSSIKPYAPTSGVSGNLNAVGSDTLNNLMTLWAEGFSKNTPASKSALKAKALPLRRPPSRQARPSSPP